MTQLANPQVSVVIPAFNAASTIARQLRALAEQAEAPPFEVVVVDNRSDDVCALAEACEQFRHALQLRIVTAAVEQSVSYARNVGIREARADRLLFCDADDVVARHWVRNGVLTCDVAPIWSGSVTMVPDESLSEPLDDVWGRLPDDSTWAPPVDEQHGAAFPVILGGNFGATRAALEHIGGFDASFSRRAEDNDLAIRAARLGYSIPVSKVVHLAAGYHDGRQRSLALADAEAHAMLLARHDLWRYSRFKSWPEEWLRLGLDGLRMALIPRRRDWEAWWLRAARTVGFTRGALKFRTMQGLPAPRVGDGWHRRETCFEVPDSRLGVPEASVIIPAYNAAPWICEQLEALEAQVDAPPFEVVIADNGSTDDLVAQVGQRRWSFPVRVVDAAGVPSAAYARNLGASVAHAEWLLFCDADDVVAPTWASSLLRALGRTHDLLVQGSVQHERFNDDEVRAAYRLPPDWNDEQYSALPSVSSAGGYAGYLPTVPGGSFACSRPTYFLDDGMDASYPGAAEETDFSWRLQLRGVEVVAAPRAVIHYRLKSTARLLFRQQRVQQLGRVLLWVRNRHSTMQGPSWKASLMALARLLWCLPNAQDRSQKLAWARDAGAHAGALQGMVRYRLLKRIPSRRTWSDVR